MRKDRGTLFIALAILPALPFLVFWPSIGLSRLQYWLCPTASPAWSLLYFPAFGTQLLFSKMVRYAVFSVVALGLSGAALAWLAIRLRGRAWRSGWFYLHAIALLAVVTFPLTVRYRPAAEPTPGVEMRMVEPPGFLESPVRACQAAAEMMGCQYEVLGWADERTLVYRRWCGGYHDVEGWHPGTPGEPLAYDLETGTVTPFGGGLEGLFQERCLASHCVIPALQELHPGRHYLPGRYDAPTLSPDGRWVAFVAQHIYGPEDLLVLAVKQ